MLFLKTRQERIGVFTQDQRRIDNAVVCLDDLEWLLRKFLGDPYGLDEYAIEKLLEAHAKAACSQAVAASGKSTIVDALRELASRKERELHTASAGPDCPATTIQILMCQAMLEYINREVTAWQQGRDEKT
jgi:hypothetical protein